ncbi:ribosomal RNA large subunit methyltransferase J protein [Toxoplasma gondii GT1]|uniref:Putative rRNA methyltransferase n=3 Tax=Toxoplasma gondii TaxID=5811 RepID=A0A125YWK0_TOXGG|nr:ribosomal RNA large subunit methyltransferase J protein [Toxoplasma gondii GT1]KAF4645990.1 ribosomal RNA large subunit methyltransferase J protein [Toxoplasma gondii]CAJ20540.1 methyltransferase, putative [Toxoplasma gondii RH]
MAGGDSHRKKKTGKQRLDKFYHLAKEQGYRARSAFKLLQLSQRFRLFEKSCASVVDLCAAPGGWLQVAAKHCPVATTIVGVDLVPIAPIRGVQTFTGDITTPQCAAKLRKLVKFGEVDLVLHDGSPNMGTDWSVDAFSQNVLVLCAAKLACQLLAAGATFVSKVFRSADYAALLYVLQTLFERVDATKPQASRAVSAEIFVVCRGFRKPPVLDERLFDPKHVFLQGSDDGDAPAAAQKAVRRSGGDDGAAQRLAEGDEADDGEAAEEEEEDEEREGIFFGSRGGRKGQFAELVRRRLKRHRNGDLLAGLRRVTIDEFFRSKDPTTLLVEQAREIFFQTPAVALEEAVRNHRLTTPETLACLADVQVLGKAELAALLKWRFRVKKDVFLALGLRTHAAAEKPPAGANEDGEERDRDEADSAEIDEELTRLHASVTRREAKQQKRQAQKQKQLEMRKKLTRGAFFDEAEGPLDPDLFQFDRKAIDLLEKKEAKMVDAELLLTGGEDDDGNRRGRHADGGEGEAVVAGSESEAEEEGSLEELDDVDRMEVELTLAHRLKKQREAEALAAGPKKKETRREKVTGEWVNELQAFRSAMQRRAGEALAERRRAEEEEDDEEENEEDAEDASKEVFEDEAPAGLRKATAADRWFGQPIFAGLESPGVQDESDAECSPIARSAGDVASDEQRLSDSEASSGDDEVETEATSDVMRELADEELPAVPLSEKQKQKKRRATQAEKERNRKQRRQATDGIVGPDFDDDDDKTGLRGKTRIEEVPPPPAFQRPTDPEEIAHIQALGSLMVQKSTRMDLLDGAYNRYAFNDDALPEWFAEDEEAHTRPELPVTKELMREYRQKLLDISRRPIRKVREARARKKMREQRRLQKVKSQVAAVAESTEFTEASKARAIDKIARKARHAEEKRGKDYVVTRRVGGGKLAQKKAGKKGGGNNRVKLVDRRLKKDKRAMKAAMKKKGGQRRGLKKKSRKS